MGERHLTLAQTAASERAPVAPRRMMDAREIAAEKFSGKVTPRWVRDTVPGKRRLSHSVVLWYEDEVDAWIAAREAA